MADGGTLFLDEIGDVSLKTQVDLLRVLEEKRIVRVGGNAAIPVDFRLIAATNRNLEVLVSDGKFREDLYYRINVFSITVPPLRERREDIGILLDHFLEKFSRSMNKPLEGFSEEASRQLERYDWPGNVRELQNAVERAVIVARGPRVEASDLSVQPSAAPPADGEKSLASMEKSHIASVLEETGWNISRAAKLLRIDRVTLYNKLKKYGLRKEEP
jgi:two-component system response regulator HydG